jgi:hypothetical protein
MSEKPFLAPLPDDMPEHLRAALDSPHGRLTRAIVKGLVPVLREKFTAQIEEAVAPLRRRIAELEAEPSAKWLGVWREGKSFRAGSLVTHQGGLWHAETTTMNRPGDASGDWKLAVKKGSVV